MPINDKQQAFINEYRVNGHNATQAYRKAYPDCKSGADRAGHRLLSNVEIRAAIAKDMAKSSVKTETTVATVQAMFQAAYDQAKDEHQTSAMVSAATGIARLHGMDKDNQLHTDKPVDIPDAELELVEEMARQELKRERALKLA